MKQITLLLLVGLAACSDRGTAGGDAMRGEPDTSEAIDKPAVTAPDWSKTERKKPFAESSFCAGRGCRPTARPGASARDREITYELAEYPGTRLSSKFDGDGYAVEASFPSTEERFAELVVAAQPEDRTGFASAISDSIFRDVMSLSDVLITHYTGASCPKGNQLIQAFWFQHPPDGELPFVMCNGWQVHAGALDNRPTVVIRRRN